MLLVGVLASAIGELFGLDTAISAADTEGDGFHLRVGSGGPYTAMALAYFTYLHATSAGQSIGNKVLGIRVLDADSGGSLPFLRAFVRALMSYVSAIALFLGYFWMLWDGRKQTWHDKVASSLVVRSSAYPPGEWGRLSH